MLQKILLLGFLVLLMSGYTVSFTAAEDISEAQVQTEAQIEAEQEAKTEAPTVKSNAETITAKGIALDTVWTLLAAILVMFMQPGFALLEAGFTRAKNACNILMKNLMDFAFGSISYWVIGFGIMFGAGNLLFGTSGFFLNDTGSTFDSLSWSTVPLDCKYFFQLVFCATAATIVSGAMAERTKFVAYIFYSIVISAIIYPISGHWIWGGGWLAEIGMWDFAGSTVVHSVGGWIGLTGAVMLGSRIGKYRSDGSPNSIPGHSIPLAALGVFILWFGWFGFNPGSTMGAIPDIAHIAATTNIAAAAGSIGAMLTAWWMFKRPDASMAFNGVVAGLVAITCPCAFKIKHISDAEGYLDAIGRRKNAEVRRDARITEANAEAEARLVAAEAKKKGNVAEAEADMTIVEAENKLRVKKADLAAEANMAEAKAEVASDIARVEQEQKLEETRVERNRMKYEADIIVPARAQKEAQELKAIGEAARIAEDGKATAEAVRVLREQWEKEDTRELFLIQQLPDILDKVTKVVSDNLSIDKVTIVDSGDGHGMPAYVKGVTGSIVAIMEQIKNATGLDIPDILRAKAKTN